MAFDIDANLTLLLQPPQILRIGKPKIRLDRAVQCRTYGWPANIQLFGQIKLGR
jgi:hypothetical protein